MSFNNPRVFGLDILRATAILLVILTHSIYFFTDSWENFDIIKFLPDGVSIFFVLSGFLIGNILIKTLQKKDVRFDDLRNFWIRRWFRTLSAYFFILSIVIASTWLIYGVNKSLWNYLKYYLFLQAFNNGNCNVYAESWSLCVEEFFYLFIPALLFLLIRYTTFRAKNIFLFCILLIIALGTWFTIYKINSHHYITPEEWDMYIRKTVFTRLSSIMYGFLGAYVMFYHYHLWKHKTIFLITGLGLFIFLSIRPAFGIGPYFNYEQLSLESIATLLLIPKLTSIQNSKGSLFRALTFISSISYSIYLINYTPFYNLVTGINSIFNFHSARFSFVRLALFLAWSFGGGYLVYCFVEKPFMKKRELFSRKDYVYIKAKD